MKQHKQEKILILTSRFGNGHYSVSEALMEDYSEQGHTVQILDIVEVIFPKLHKVIYKIFNNIICRNGRLYNFCNSFGLKERKTKSTKKLMQKITQLSPDRIVITWSGCSKMLGNTVIPVTVCITDMALHPGWIYPKAETYIVASDDVAKKLSEYGVSHSKIEANGIPVKKTFHFGLKFVTSKRKLLIMGGGLGIIPWLGAVLDRLAKQNSLEITVIAGRNEKLRRYLTNSYPTIRTIGFTNELHRYLSQADLVVSKPGGVSIFESIYVGTPFVAVYPEFAHEIDNANYLIKNKIGAVIWKHESIEARILSFINDTEYLQQCRYSMAKLRNGFYQGQRDEKLEIVYQNAV